MYRYQEVDIDIAQPEGFEPLPTMAAELPNVFSMADDDEFPALPRRERREFSEASGDHHRFNRELSIFTITTNRL